MLALILAASLTATRLPLPAGPPVSMDYLAAAAGQVWVPGGNTGKVFVLERGKFRTLDGFPTKKGRGDRLLGPSSVGIGRAAAWIGNRGDSRICGFDLHSLEKRGCVEVPGMPDGTFYVAPTLEIWVTTPRENSIQIVDVSGAPKLAGKLELGGAPEGYAVDAGRGMVYTNLEDKDRTLAIDARTRKIVATFEPGCGEAGPRGLALDAGRKLLFVACTDGVVVLDEETGARKGRLETGKGVDNIDYLPRSHRLFVSAGQDGQLTVADVGPNGNFRPVGSAQVGKGCRVVVATEDGTAYAADSTSGALWVVKP